MSPEGLRFWREEGNSNAKHCASCRAGPKWISVASPPPSHGSVVTILVRDRHENSIRPGCQFGRGGQGWRIFRSLLGTARMLLSTRHRGRSRLHEKRWHKARVCAGAAGMIVLGGGRRLRSLLSAGGRDCRQCSRHIHHGQGCHHQSDDKLLLHSQLTGPFKVYRRAGSRSVIRITRCCAAVISA